MGHFGKYCQFTALIAEVQYISFLCYGVYNMPHVNNLNFPEYMFAF